MTEAIRIEHLSFKYPDGQEALNDVSLTINRGEKVALIGPNGAGKSTLLLHFNGIMSNNGRVRVLNMNVESKNLKAIRNRVGMVFQDPDDQLFSPTVFDDVAFGPINMGLAKEEVNERVKRALSRVGMSGYESRSPHHLSRGEKKRIAIATVLSMDPEILVLDEPTSDLDPRSKWALVELLKGLNLTEVITTHDLEIVKSLCRRVVVMDQGRIVADGATERIIAEVDLLTAHGLAPAAESIRRLAQSRD